MIVRFLILLLVVSYVCGQFPNGRKLEGPMPELCEKRIIHETSQAGINYFYHWRENIDEEDWLGARNYCRMRCMDLVSLETKEKNEWLKSAIARDDVDEVWTSGRICDFNGCNRPDLLPKDVNGWFWTSIFAKLPPTTDRISNDWSETGELGKRQPDNREYSINRKLESCLAVFNNKYNDGIKWHDAVCSRRRSFACEDSKELLQYARYIRPDLKI